MTAATFAVYPAVPTFGALRPALERAARGAAWCAQSLVAAAVVWLLLAGPGLLDDLGSVVPLH